MTMNNQEIKANISEYKRNWLIVSAFEKVVHSTSLNSCSSESSRLLR